MKNIHRSLLFLSACACLIGFDACAASAHDDNRNDRSHVHAPAAHAGSFGQSGSARDVARTIAITMNDTMRFDPDALAIKQGQTVRLRITNAGKVEHEFVLGTAREIAEHARMMREMPDMAHADPNAVRVAPGKTAEIVWKFNKPGSFLYACLIPGHREAGMQGVIMVTNQTRP